MDGLAFDDMDEFGRELDDPFEELLQDVVHGLIEAFGSNPDVQTRGAGLVGKLSSSALGIPTTKAMIEAQLHDDTRLTSARCEITPDLEPGAYRVDLVLVVNGEEIDLTLRVDGAGGVKRLS